MMLASQLLRIPQVVEADVENDTHDFATAGPKPTMKKNLRTIAVQTKGSGRDSAHLTYEIAAKDYFFKAPDYECNIVVDDFSNRKETEVKDSVTFRKGTHFYTSKKIREHELPELIVCYKESTYHDIKDICVDEGVVPSEKKDDTEFLPNDDEKLLLGEYLEDEAEVRSGKSSSCKDCVGQGKNVDDVENEPDGLNSSSESDSDIDLVEVGKENLNPRVIDDAARDGFVSSSSFSVDLFRPRTWETSCDAHSDVSQRPRQKSCTESVPSKRKIPARLLCYDSKVEGGTITFNFTCRKTTSSTKSKDIVTEQPLNLQNEFLSEEDKISSQVHFGERDSNFSVSRTSSGLITFSGQIPFSGRISLGSDSSSTSTRSFAFPILQPEWSSSPVRMAKADRRHFRRHRGWRHGLLCCRGF